MREADVVAEVEKDERDRQDRDERVNESPAEKDAEAVGEIAERLGQEGIDLTFANVGCDLPFVLGRRDEIRDEDHQQVVVDHRPVVVALHAAAFLGEDGAPEEDGARERDQPEDRAEKIIPAVNEGVLQAELEDGGVFGGA